MSGDNRTYAIILVMICVIIVMSFALVYAWQVYLGLGEMVCGRTCPKHYDAYFTGFYFDDYSSTYGCGNCVYSLLDVDNITEVRRLNAEG